MILSKGNIGYFERIRAIYDIILSSRFQYGYLRMLSNESCEKKVEESSAPKHALTNVVRNLQKKIEISLNEKQFKRKVTISNVNFKKEIENLKIQQFPKAFTEDIECDNEIRYWIQKQNPVKAIDKLRTFAIQNKYPSRKTIIILARVCASSGDVEGIKSVRDISEIAFPAENSWQMQYRHYEAEALWRKGDFEKSLQIFEELFQKYPLQRRKLTNMINFYMRHVINERISSQYHKLLAFVEKCIRIKEYVPASNLWRVTFCSESFEVQCIADNLLEKNNELLAFIGAKFESIIDDAQNLKRADILQRLMQLVLTKKLINYYSLVFSSYVDYLCDMEDVNGAIETFNYVSKSSIFIPHTSFQKIFTLLARHGRKVPSNALELKYDTVINNSKLDYKF